MTIAQLFIQDKQSISSIVKITGRTRDELIPEILAGFNSIKEFIEFIKDNQPKSYSVIIKSIPTVYEWVQQNSLVDSDSIAEQVNSILTQTKPSVCQYGNTQKFDRDNKRYTFCGTASQCQCLKDHYSDKTKQFQSTVDQDAANKKRRTTMLEKYGHEYNSQRPEVKDKLRFKLPMHLINQLDDKQWLTEQYVTQNKTSVEIGKELGVYYGTVCWWC